MHFAHQACQMLVIKCQIRKKGYSQLPNKMKEQQQQQQQTNHKRTTTTEKEKHKQTPLQTPLVDFCRRFKKSVSTPGSSLVPSISQGSSICIPHLLHRSAPWKINGCFGSSHKRVVYTANWVIIYHLRPNPPIKGTRNNHWFEVFFWFGFFAGFCRWLICKVEVKWNVKTKTQTQSWSQPNDGFCWTVSSWVVQWFRSYKWWCIHDIGREFWQKLVWFETHIQTMNTMKHHHHHHHHPPGWKWCIILPLALFLQRPLGVQNSGWTCRPLKVVTLLNCQTQWSSPVSFGYLETKTNSKSPCNMVVGRVQLPLWFRRIFRGELLVLGRVYFLHIQIPLENTMLHGLFCCCFF